MISESLGTLTYERAGTLTDKNTGSIIIHTSGTLTFHSTGDLMLFYFATRFHFFFRSDDRQLAVEVFSREDHTFRYDAFQLTRSKVGNKTNLFSNSSGV